MPPILTIVGCLAAALGWTAFITVVATEFVNQIRHDHQENRP